MIHNSFFMVMWVVFCNGTFCDDVGVSGVIHDNFFV